MGLILFLLTLAVLTTVSITLLFYLCWFYDRRSFPEQAQLPGEQPLRLLPTLVGEVDPPLAIAAASSRKL